MLGLAESLNFLLGTLLTWHVSRSAAASARTSEDRILSRETAPHGGIATEAGGFELAVTKNNLPLI